MYVEYRKLAHASHSLPVLLWHGGGFTGSVWESTPDGRPGWESWFLSHGWNVYISDAMERGRSGFSQFPEVYRSAPLYRSEQEAWGAFRIGNWYSDPSLRGAFPGQDFPIASFGEMMKEAVPRWVDNDDAIQAAYDELIVKACPCVLVAHSQGGMFAIRAAAHYPKLVRAMVLLEPSGVPSLSQKDLSNLRSIPQLFIWGDFISSSRIWMAFQKPVRQYYISIKAGNVATWLDLPAQGLHGDSHLLMMNRDSDSVAGLVNEWLDAKVHRG
jgi:pimeloyl-ACP methyl ester carboxylesterase